MSTNCSDIESIASDQLLNNFEKTDIKEEVVDILANEDENGMFQFALSGELKDRKISDSSCIDSWNKYVLIRQRKNLL